MNIFSVYNLVFITYVLHYLFLSIFQIEPLATYLIILPKYTLGYFKNDNSGLVAEWVPEIRFSG